LGARRCGVADLDRSQRRKSRGAARRAATNNGAVSKLVKAWEAKNGQSAKRVAGLGLMAVSLAACGGSDDSDDGDDDVVVVDTPVAYSLSDELDLITGEDGEALTITGDAGTLNDNDAIDGTDSGDDVLNVTIDEDVAPTITGIEDINVELDVIRGADAVIDATDVDGATITITGSRQGYDGEAEVDEAGDNNIVAGTNVETLTIAGLTTGVVDAGAAETVSVTTDDDGDTATIIVNGDVDLTVATAETLDITATAASEVTLTPGAVDTITADSNTSLVMTAAQATTLDISGAAALSISTAAGAATDLSGVDSAVEITFDDAMAAADVITVADGASLTIGEDAADSTFTLTVGDDDETFTLSTGFDITSLTVTVAEAVSIVTTDDVTIAALVTVAASDATITVDGDLTITALTSAQGSVTLAGTGDVEMDADAAASIDASDLTGDLTATQTGTGSIEVTAGSGDLDLTLAAIVLTSDADVIGQAGDDTLDARLVATAATIIFASGEGDDTLELAGADIATIDFDGGDGDDTLLFANAADLGGATLTLTDVEIIELEGAAATVLAETVTGESFSITGAGFAVSTLTIELDAAGDTADLSSLDVSDSVASGAAISVLGGAGDDEIIGTDIGDTIDAAGGADSITLGDGDDTVTFDFTDSVAATSIIDATDDTAMAAADIISVGDTITFDNGVDVVTGFDVDADEIDVATAGAAVSALGEAADSLDDVGLAATDDTLFLSGIWDADTATFEITADGAGTDTMVLSVDAGTVGASLLTSTSLMILVGVESGDLVAANFI
jgi:hypothetical protein